MADNKANTSGSTGEAISNFTRTDLGSGRWSYVFTFEGVEYSLEGPLNEEFEEWLPGYAALTPRCGCCREIMFPGETITLGYMEELGDWRHAHLSGPNGRCMDSHGDRGHFLPDGVYVSAYAGQGLLDPVTGHFLDPENRKRS